MQIATCISRITLDPAELSMPMQIYYAPRDKLFLFCYIFSVATGRKYFAIAIIKISILVITVYQPSSSSSCWANSGDVH